MSVFPSIDRFADKFPWQSPYTYASNNPVTFIDINGDSTYYYSMYDDMEHLYTSADGGDEYDQIIYTNELSMFDNDYEERRGEKVYSNGRQRLMPGVFMPEMASGQLATMDGSDDPIFQLLTAGPFWKIAGANVDDLSVLGISAMSRKQATRKAKDFAKVPRNSKGGADILMDELNPSSRGSVWEQMKSWGAKKLGRKNPKGKNQYMEHPDGHPDAGGVGVPKHHSQGHIHSTNSKGEKKIFPYGGG